MTSSTLGDHFSDNLTGESFCTSHLKWTLDIYVQILRLVQNMQSVKNYFKAGIIFFFKFITMFKSALYIHAITKNRKLTEN